MGPQRIRHAWGTDTREQRNTFKEVFISYAPILESREKRPANSLQSEVPFLVQKDFVSSC